MINTVLGPIEWVVSWIMVAFHTLFSTLGMNEDGGLTWGLSIVGLVVVIRILLIPLFVKQIRSQRAMQQLQPQIKALQTKYKGDRERLGQETMKLYKENGTNPLASCFPLLLQAPIFFALFRVLNGISHGKGLGYLEHDPSLVDSASNARLFGAPISAAFLHPGDASTVNVRVVAAILIVLMSASMFYTQRQLMTKNMPKVALEGPFAQQQKIMLYLFPAIFLVTGVNFPIGVLIYWFTTNVWSMFQQLFVIARMPAPGSLAEERRNARTLERAVPGTQAASTPVAGGASVAPVVEGGQPGQRAQPKRKRSQGGTPAVAPPAAPAPPTRTGQRQQPKRTTRKPPGKAAPPGRRPNPEGPAPEAS